MNKNEIIATIEDTGDLMMGSLSNEFDVFNMEKATGCTEAEIRAAATALYVVAKYMREDKSASAPNFAAAISTTINNFRNLKVEED